MTTSALTIICVGEVMVELNREPDGRFALAFGGDTFNTAVYLARSGVGVAYATALGDERFSDEIVALAEREGVGTQPILRARGRVPGLYLIETDASGERRFTYWRETSPARELFELPGWERVAEAILDARLIYLSAITLSLYSTTGLGRLLAVLEAARARGALIAFDSNFRPRGWGGDFSRARAVIAEALARVDIALPTFEDEASLWGDRDPMDTAERLAKAGPREIVIKRGAEGALIATSAGVANVPIPAPVTPVDTTAAGDSFNAAYLAARLSGKTPAEAALSGHHLAGIVIGHRGAIVPKSATDTVSP